MPSIPGKRAGSQSALRESNRALVLDALRSSGTLIQAELARVTGLSAATVSNIVRDLSGDGLLRVTTTISGGRRARAVSLDRAAGVAAGIDFGRRHVRVALADLSHSVLGEHEVAVAPRVPASEAIEIGVEVFHSLLDAAGVGTDALVGVGVGLPGPIDARDGLVGSASILPEWVGVNAAEVIGASLGMGVSVDNDANLGALAELTWGAARGHRDVVYIKIASGVGAGLVLGGELHRGHIGTAGEIGHLTMDENGQVCRCGNRGCLETMASAGIVLDLLARSHGPDLTVADVVRLAAEGDAACIRVIGDVGRHVGVAVANLCNLLNPSVVVVGGSLAAAGDVLLQPMRAAVQRYAIPAVGATTEILAGALGRRSESLGALALALRAPQRHGLDSVVPSTLDGNELTGVH